MRRFCRRRALAFSSFRAPASFSKHFFPRLDAAAATVCKYTGAASDAPIAFFLSLYTARGVDSSVCAHSPGSICRSKRIRAAATLNRRIFIWIRKRAREGQNTQRDAYRCRACVKFRVDFRRSKGAPLRFFAF